MPAAARTPALGYIRVSSYLGRDRGEALTEEVQLEKIQQWWAVADLDLVDVLRDIDRSGKDFDARGRPAFDELLQRLDAGEAGAVVVYRTSRFGRDFYETVRTVRRLRQEGIQFHSASTSASEKPLRIEGSGWPASSAGVGRSALTPERARREPPPGNRYFRSDPRPWLGRRAGTDRLRVAGLHDSAAAPPI